MEKSKLNTEDGMGLGYEMYDDIQEFIQYFQETETTLLSDKWELLEALGDRLKYRHEINGHQQL